MGSVGLSFGNPTGGTGFNVTATVSQIMANYQAVETPWTTQLTTLSAQDTALTTLGTGLSTLSAAVGALTNFQGVMATKNGSSSDPTVLTLTSAGTSAVAGSHTITVNTLAATSSWSTSTTPIGATDTLAGTISIGVAGSPAQSFTMTSSDNTLSTLAAAINTAGIGVTANVSSNASGSFLTLVSGTSGAAGNLTITGNLTDTSKSGSAVTATQAIPGKDASLTVDGVAVTSPSNTVSNAIAGVTFQLLNTSATGTSVQVQITNNTSAVTSSVETFVTAYNAVMQDLTAQQTSSTTGTAPPLLGNSSIALLQQQLGQAMNMTQNNVWDSSATPIAATDTLSGTISIGVGTGPQTSFTANGNLASLAASINSAKIGVTANVVQGLTGSYLSLVSGTTGSAGDLNISANLADTTATGAPAVTFGDTNIGSSINGFASLGITSNLDGTLSLNTDTLTSALNGSFQGVVNFFQDAASVGMGFTNTINQLGNTTPTGTISLALASDAAQETTLNTNITSENSIISAQQALLTSELTQANQTLQSLPSQLNMVNELYSAITGYGTSQS
ncbi:MAG TPA: flagellar filament capping protein FliD [Granulicella sp.]|jgi:flagellar hook-associated protein 2|nr:flagellar filament capping protein FliD [Granulicella sp.]